MLIRYLYLSSFLMPAFTFSDEKIEEEIVVVASRLDSTTQSISSLDRDSSPKFALVDQLRGLPGLSISRAGNHGALTQVRVRGAEANHVMVVIDGVQATDPAARSTPPCTAFGHIRAPPPEIHPWFREGRA